MIRYYRIIDTSIGRFKIFELVHACFITSSSRYSCTHIYNDWKKPVMSTKVKQTAAAPASADTGAVLLSEDEIYSCSDVMRR